MSGAYSRSLERWLRLPVSVSSFLSLYGDGIPGPLMAPECKVNTIGLPKGKVICALLSQPASEAERAGGPQRYNPLTRRPPPPRLSGGPLRRSRLFDRGQIARGRGHSDRRGGGGWASSLMRAPAAERSMER